MGFFSELFGRSEEGRRRSPNSSPPDLAFVDVETTGLHHQGHDRVVEIGIVRTNFWGEEKASFESLINPNRDVGPTHIHGITAGMVKEAPSFEALASPILDMLDRTYLVAHNASFDAGFLTAELERAGISVGKLPSYFTVQFSRQVYPDLPSKKLDHLCECLDISREKAHAALEDAHATRQLLAILRKEKPDIVSDAHEPVLAGDFGQKDGADPLSRSRFREQRRQLELALGGLLARLPSVETGEAGAEAYAALLDKALRDRMVSDKELEALESLAENYGVAHEVAK